MIWFRLQRHEGIHAGHNFYRCKQCVVSPLLVTFLSQTQVNSCWGSVLWMETIWLVFYPCLLQTPEKLKVQNAVNVNNWSLPELQVPSVSWTTSYWGKKPLMFRCHCSHRFHEWTSFGNSTCEWRQACDTRKHSSFQRWTNINGGTKPII